MKCVIYKGRRKADTYLYVECADDFSRVPEPLLQMLGALERVMELDLDQARKLAYADVGQVRRLLVEQGYFLQLPPRDERALQ